MLGVIADDFTGASDIASFLVENGLKVIQMNGVPNKHLSESVDAIVISLKSRSNPSSEAIEQSLSALKWLQNNGCSQFYFKYCSTFDSTDKGNIGPVTDALLDELGEDFTIIAPSLPINGRIVFNGYLFVNGVLLNESGMKDHPITPMRDASLIRLMDAQSRGKTALISYIDIEKGTEHIKECFSSLKQKGYRYAVVDAINDAQLEILAKSISSLKLVTGGSGLGAHIASCLSTEKEPKKTFTPAKGKTVILSGSCSVMTNSQVNYYKNIAPSYFLDVNEVMHNPDYVNMIIKWVLDNLDNSMAPMVYATVSPEELKKIQAKFGQSSVSKAIEDIFGKLAEKLQQLGVVNFIIAGGETSSIVVQKLNFNGFYIGKQIAPGVPWLKSIDNSVYLALKSGNFGLENFFKFAQEMFV